MKYSEYLQVVVPNLGILRTAVKRNDMDPAFMLAIIDNLETSLKDDAYYASMFGVTVDQLLGYEKLPELDWDWLRGLPCGADDAAIEAHEEMIEAVEIYRDWYRNYKRRWPVFADWNENRLALE